VTSQGGEWFVKGILLSSQLGERDRFLICSQFTEQTYHYHLLVTFVFNTEDSDRFHLKPLLPLLTGDGRFYILALSQNQVRLLQGTRYSVRGLYLSFCSTADFTVVKPIDLDVLAYGCDRVRDYLRTNQEVQQRDTPDGTQGERHLCDGIGDR
jgi:hypothetical protein